MPIDLKWVRSDPDQVREWQSLRKRRDDGFGSTGGSNDVTSMDLVESVLCKDEISRKNLLTLQDHKKSLKQLQLRLRPKKPKNDRSQENNNDARNPQENQELGREEILKEKKAMETKIRVAEADWKASLQETHQALCKLASPVTIMKPNGDGNCDYDLDASEVTEAPFSMPSFGNTKSSIGMDLEQAWRQYTLRYFASYTWVEMPRGIPVVEMPSDLSKPPHFASITPNRAHELWGGCLPPLLSSDNSSRELPATVLPSWIRLLNEFLPNKSIWGEKELPRFCAIWSGGKEDSSDPLPGLSSMSQQPFCLSLVAVMAPSLVDAREIQKKFVQELLEYYGSLLMVNESSTKNALLLKRIVVAAPDLHHHERSRIEIHLEMNSLPSVSSRNDDKISTLRLGWVSHWGDAATRACDMAFAGGGVVQAGGKKKYGKAKNAASKEFVHLVEASVVDESSETWKKLLYANSTKNAASNNTDGSTDLSLNVPSVLVPHLVRPIADSSSVRLKDLFLDEKSKKKRKESVFGVLGDVIQEKFLHKDKDKNKHQEPDKLSSNNGEGTNTVVQQHNSFGTLLPKFPPLVVPSSVSPEELEKRIHLEKLSCPYEFLFE